MTTQQFRAEDWVYVPDAMGRVGQGYYKNRNNPGQTITPTEFERRRAQPVHITTAETEQNINKNIASVVNLSAQDGYLATGSGSTDNLSPWDNPVVGEQTVGSTASPAKSESPATTTTQTDAATIQTATETATPKEATNPQKKNQQAGRESGESNGADAGGESSSSVVCTELVAQGRMTQRDHKYSTYYAQNCLPESFMKGYHFWAIPYVGLMRKHKWAVALIEPFVSYRTREILYRLGRARRGSILGKMICGAHDRLCSALGRWISPSDYSHLYGQEG